MGRFSRVGHVYGLVGVGSVWPSNHDMKQAINMHDIHHVGKVIWAHGDTIKDRGIDC